MPADGSTSLERPLDPLATSPLLYLNYK